MGIAGLTSFIDENPMLLTDFRLCDTKVVIDGNNLFHFLYSYFNIASQFGGDYDIFCYGVRTYFQKLKLCNIEAFVIFDGAYASDGKKLPTALRRAGERIKNVEIITSGHQCKISPLLVYETFRCVLDELSVNHVTCDYEADNQLTALANQLGCPVISNDSDFFIYDLKAGFILIDYMNLHVYCENEGLDNQKEKQNHMKVQIFYLDTLLSYFPGINREVIPLYATILGNDYIPKEAFESFFANARLPSASDKPFFLGAKRTKGTPERWSKFVRLLMWLETEDCLNDAVESAMRYIHKSKKDDVRKLLKQSINEYVNPETGLLHYLVTDSSYEAKVVNFASDLRTFAGNPLPNWFIMQIRQGLMPVYICLNSLITRRVILLTQVEDLGQLSAYTCSQNLREVVYSILLTVDQKDDQQDEAVIEEYCRKGKNLKKNIISPLAVMAEKDIAIPNLCEMESLSNEVRLEYLLGYLHIKHDVYLVLKDLVADHYLLPVLIILYWVEVANPRVNNVHVKSLLVCFLYRWLKECSGTKKTQSPTTSTDFGYKISEENERGNSGCSENKSEISTTSMENDELSHLGHGILVQDVERTIERLKKFTKSPDKLPPSDTPVIHAFTQYQTCLQAAMCLNQVLLCPLANPNPAIIVNGSYLYNLYKELRNRKFPSLYLEEMLGRSSTVLGYINQVYEIITGNLSCEDKLLMCVPGNKNAKKLEKKKQKKKSKKSVSNTDTGVSLGANLDEEGALKSINSEDEVDVSNKFSSLEMEFS